MKYLTSMFCALIMTFMASVSMASPLSETIVLNPEDTLILRGPVTAESVANIIQQFTLSKADEFIFYINSPGGSILAGNNLTQAMKSSGKKFTCVVNVAASMAFVILQACDIRLVTENAVVMQHVASYGLEGQAPNNNTMNSFINRMVDKIDRDQAERIGMSLADFKAITRDDWWLFGNESVKVNVADDLTHVRCSEKLANIKINEEIRTFFGNIKVVWSGCPVVEHPLEVKFEYGTSMSLNEANRQLNRVLDQYKPREYLLNRPKGEWLP